MVNVVSFGRRNEAGNSGRRCQDASGDIGVQARMSLIEKI